MKVKFMNRHCNIKKKIKELVMYLILAAIYGCIILLVLYYLGWYYVV